MSFVIGVDVGTQSTKGLVMDAEGNILASSSATYGIINKKPLWAEQHPDVWLNATKQVIQDLVKEADVPKGTIKSVCISSLYGGAGIPVNENIEPLYPCLIWMDRRADEQVDWVLRNVDTEQLFKINGNSCDSYYGYTKILWIRRSCCHDWHIDVLGLYQ
jgi:sugar (pentulose or hexulose) kinase